MELSLFLAKLIGFYFIIISVYLLVRYKEFEVLARDFVASASLLFIGASVATILGLSLVIGHNIWVPDWRVAITIIGWVILIKGLVRLFLPDLVKRVTDVWFTKKIYTIVTAVICILIGLYLLYHGYNPDAMYTPAINSPDIA